MSKHLNKHMSTNDISDHSQLSKSRIENNQSNNSKMRQSMSRIKQLQRYAANVNPRNHMNQCKYRISLIIHLL